MVAKVIDLDTILNPQKLEWQQGVNESIARIVPGPPNTTLDRSAIGEQEAQDVFNVTMANGVWELDTRYRQFAPIPISVSDIVYHESTPPTAVVTNCTTGGLQLILI